VKQAAQDTRSDAGATPKRVVICIDDFGYDEAVDRSIFALAALGRISATGALVDAPCWAADGPRLAGEFGRALDIGLHLNLTESFPGWQAPADLGALIRRAYTGGLKPAEMRAEVARQLDSFEAVAGRAPDFVDGHRHVHQLPVVREALLAEVRERYAARLPWVRCTLPPTGLPGTAGERFKASFIGWLGAGTLRRQVAAAGLRQNRCLLGVYGFEGDVAQQQARLAGWVAAASQGDLLMCHTALGGGSAADPISAARQVEHQAMASSAFGELLERMACIPARL
jgi:hypothetical protein